MAIRNARATTRQAETASSRHDEQTKADQLRRITETYSKAVEQISSEKIEQRLGGIYTLERISREILSLGSPTDYWTIMETLTAFVRDRAHWGEPDVDATGEEIAHFSEDLASIVRLHDRPAGTAARCSPDAGGPGRRSTGARKYSLRSTYRTCRGHDITTISGHLQSHLIAWLADAGNGIHDLYAGIIHSREDRTDKLCVGSTCITQAQLDSILAQRANRAGKCRSGG
jgi:hypothetical protein